VLTDRGLGAAVEALATRSTVPVDVETTDEPLPRAVEAAAYYVIAESLANVGKYADASEVTVRVSHDNGCARIEVADDGVGGADAADGSGLRGLADRVAALEGTLTVDSPPGGGTRVSAEIPLESAPQE
jgi:signal transduction histidine kinase